MVTVTVSRGRPFVFESSFDVLKFSVQIMNKNENDAINMKHFLRRNSAIL